MRNQLLIIKKIYRSANASKLLWLKNVFRNFILFTRCKVFVVNRSNAPYVNFDFDIESIQKLKVISVGRRGRVQGVILKHSRNLSDETCECSYLVCLNKKDSK